MYICPSSYLQALAVPCPFSLCRDLPYHIYSRYFLFASTIWIGLSCSVYTSLITMYVPALAQVVVWARGMGTGVAIEYATDDRYTSDAAIGGAGADPVVYMVLDSPFVR